MAHLCADSTDVEMNNVIATRLISAQSVPVIGALILLLLSPRPAYPETPKPGQQRVVREQTESGTNPQFLSALQAYKSQEYATAQKQLEALVQKNAGNFEINELLGLVYVAQGEQEKANRFLAKAVQIRPNLTEARTRLGTNFLALNQNDQAAIQFKKAVQLAPHDYDANHNLGEFYIQTGNISASIPFLQRAQESNPAAYNNGYDLALALDEAGRLDEARQQLQRLISLRDSAELHGVLGEVEEKSQNYLASAAQYEQAARMDPSEQNILNWGAELLLHQTFAPAVEVFKAGTQRYPQSGQLYNGLGIALYGEGQTDDAIRAYFRASDLMPSEQLSMIFVGKACEGASPVLADQIRARLQSFLEQSDDSAELDYDLAVCWLKTGQAGAKADRDVQVESHLKHALLLNPNYGDAFFQLGALYADQRKYAEAVEQYERALKINPNAANTHYRLGQALARLGNDTRAQEELAIFQRLRKSESEATDSKQNQIQQFVYSIKNSNSNQ